MGECEIYQVERDVFEEEMKKINECDMEKVCAVDSSEKPIAKEANGDHRRGNRKEMRF